jgi:succinate-semialdehyde dehydrogenase/glutarate-semialdehyde dehydrogenase
MSDSLQTIDPATGRSGRTYDAHSPDEALAVARRVRAAFPQWRDTAVAERAGRMRAVAGLLRERRADLAALMTAEMGKTRTEGLAEIEKCAGACEYFAGAAAGFLERRPVDIGGPKAFITYNPLGVVLAIMPWNFPFWQVFRFAAPHLMAGNAAVLKHASNVPGCAMAIEQLFRDAGFPQDVFRTVLIGGGAVKALIDDDAIAAVTLTGSVAAGRSVAAAAGAALKKTVLELGGSDAYVILADADVAKAAEVCTAARMVNGGQSCIAGKRFIVVPQIREAFEAAFTEAMRAYAPADPSLETTRLGPMVSVKARDEIHDQVRRSLAAGARLLAGGEVPDRSGAWYPATVLADVAPGMAAFEEEVFGPVAAIVPARDEADAIALANRSRFGLGSGVITADRARGEAIAANDLQAGLAFVNQNVRSDARLPFGGVKSSGYGRECADFGFYEFLNIKSVVVA